MKTCQRTQACLSDKERFGHNIDQFKVYKAILCSGCLKHKENSSICRLEPGKYPERVHQYYFLLCMSRIINDKLCLLQFFRFHELACFWSLALQLVESLQWYNGSHKRTNVIKHSGYSYN